MIPDEVMLPWVPWLCGGSFLAFSIWAAWALWGGYQMGLRLEAGQREEERQAAQRAWEDAHPSWVERKREYLRTHGVPAEYITDPRIVTMDGYTCDEWPTPSGVIISPWAHQDQDPRWKEPAHE